MLSLPLTYWATGEPQIEKSELGLKVTVQVQVNDANSRKVGDYPLAFSLPAGLKEEADLQGAVVLAANAAGKALLAGLEENLATKATVAAVSDQITG